MEKDLKICEGKIVKRKTLRMHCPYCDYYNEIKGKQYHEAIKYCHSDTILFPPWEIMICGNCGKVITRSKPFL